MSLKIAAQILLLVILQMVPGCRKHGNITEQIAAINNCTILKENKRRTINVGIVLSDNSHQPHIVIMK